MSKAVGWAVGAAIVSITIGILVGLVLHTGQIERADRPPSAGDGPARSSVTGATTDTRPPRTAPAQPLPSPALPSTVLPSALLPAAPSATPPVTSSPVTSPASPKGSGTSSTAMTPSTPATPSGTAASPRPGSDAAGAPCPTLAAPSRDADGTTLYCQVDSGDRTLRWRAVVNAGGCLNQSMTGIGADGVTYRCRLDASGLNHWAPAN